MNITKDSILDAIPGTTTVNDIVSSVVGDAIYPVDPETATETGKPADAKKTLDLVNFKVSRSEAHYLTTKRDGAFVPFASYDELEKAMEKHSTSPKFFYAEKAHDPDKNDYCIVLADETHETEVGIRPVTRYSYVGEYGKGGVFQYEYTINETALNESQWDAINSGINKEKVDAIPSALDIASSVSAGDVLQAIVSGASSVDFPGLVADLNEKVEAAIASGTLPEGWEPYATKSELEGKIDAGKPNVEVAKDETNAVVRIGYDAEGKPTIYAEEDGGRSGATMTLRTNVDGTLAYVEDIPIEQKDLDDFVRKWEQGVAYGVNDVVYGEGWYGENHYISRIASNTYDLSASAIWDVYDSRKQTEGFKRLVALSSLHVKAHTVGSGYTIEFRNKNFEKAAAFDFNSENNLIETVTVWLTNSDCCRFTSDMVVNSWTSVAGNYKYFKFGNSEVSISNNLVGLTGEASESLGVYGTNGVNGYAVVKNGALVRGYSYDGGTWIKSNRSAGYASSFLDILRSRESEDVIASVAKFAAKGKQVEKYEDLTDLPKINNKTISGNLTLSSLGIQSALTATQLSNINSIASKYDKNANISVFLDDWMAVCQYVGIGTATPTTIPNLLEALVTAVSKLMQGSPTPPTPTGVFSLDSEGNLVVDESSLNEDGTVTVDGALNDDGTYTVSV